MEESLRIPRYSPKQIVNGVSYFKLYGKGTQCEFRRKMSEILYSKEPKRTDFF